MRANIGHDNMSSIPDESAHVASGESVARAVSPLQDLLNTMIAAVIEDHYLSASGLTVAACYHELLRQIRYLNQWREADCQLQAPALNTFRRRIRQLDSYDVAGARFAKKQRPQTFSLRTRTRVHTF